MASQTVDELIRIQIEIMAGWEWGDPRTKVRDTQDNREAWDGIAKDIAKMTTAGIIPDLPHEIDI